MSQRLTLEIRYTKPGDEIPARRLTTVTLDVPAEGEPSDMQAPLLNLDGRTLGHHIAADDTSENYWDRKTLVVDLPGEREEVTPEGVGECVRRANSVIMPQIEAKQAEYRVLREREEQRSAARHAEWLEEVSQAIREGRPLREYDWQPPYAHLPSDLDPELREIADAANRRHDEECAQRRAENEERAERQAQARQEEKRSWAFAHGSPRLQGQLSQGYDGWPLYLHERLEAEFSGAHLDREAEYWDEVANPSEAQLTQQSRVVDQAYALGLYDDTDEANRNVRWRWEPPDPDEYYSADEYEAAERVPVLVMEGYRPGSAENGWRSYTITFTEEA